MYLEQKQVAIHPSHLIWSAVGGLVGLMGASGTPSAADVAREPGLANDDALVKVDMPRRSPTSMS